MGPHPIPPKLTPRWYLALFLKSPYEPVPHKSSIITRDLLKRNYQITFLHDILHAEWTETHFLST